MPQQINLLDDTLRPRPLPWRAAHGLWAVATVLLLSAAASALLERDAKRREARAAALEQQLQRERDLLARNGGLPGADATPAGAVELQRLRQLDAVQRRVQTLLESQDGHSASGYTPWFQALSRQAHPSLWITGLSVSADGAALVLQGRMTDASVLPDYLRRLNDEPQFKGRRFEQLSVKTVSAPGGVPVMEFVLRSQPGRAEAGR